MAQKQERPEVASLAKEIQRKGELVNYELLDLASGGHLSMLHVGLTDKELVSRLSEKKSTCSTFTDSNSVNIALASLFEDKYACKMIAKWVCDPSSSTRIPINGFADEEIGRMIKKNGAIVKCKAFEIILQKQHIDYRNHITELPFDVVTLYVEE